MKLLPGKIHLSRKLLLIVGGVAVLCGATGSAAVYIGRDALLGPSYSEVNGLTCMELQSATIKRKDRLWVRKYVTTDATDGVTRIKTALRIAKSVAETEKPDLVQVVVLDQKGPKDQSDIRGRAIGADVIYIPNPAQLAETAQMQSLTARYVDKQANSNGDFYGERVEMPLADASAMMAKLTDAAPCEKPVVATPEGEGKKEGENKKEGGHAKEGEASKEGTKEGSKEGAKEGQNAHGEAAPAEAHGSEAPAEEKPGLIASLKGMIFGADEKPAAHAHDATPAADAASLAPTPEGSHSDSAAPHQANADKASTQQQSVDHAVSEKAGEPVPVAASSAATPAPAATSPVAAADPTPQAVESKAESKGWLSSIKSMVTGTDKPPAATASQAEAQSDAKPLVTESSTTPSVLPRGISLR
ncbi:MULTISPECIES: hypothetical protein [Rhizobium/Agrobacterium group]|uniref:hypothetical protein n=1 Tax=Rhizobium/Agrobacterium group TaxID=227290 RepID=UPI001177C505|nr:MULTISPECIES: hypothetical protein [Rhizobium/Agrobacterium group]MCF1482463.1 hypothetical protein [Allorhizobium ampelinum]NSZ43896.1 hypothetical protein [Agrobacterium vitis]NTA27644.1 hypothetical protein [Allorhizobium ampelinum]